MRFIGIFNEKTSDIGKFRGNFSPCRDFVQYIINTCFYCFLSNKTDCIFSNIFCDRFLCSVFKIINQTRRCNTSIFNGCRNYALLFNVVFVNDININSIKMNQIIVTDFIFIVNNIEGFRCFNNRCFIRNKFKFIGNIIIVILKNDGSLIFRRIGSNQSIRQNF